MQYALLALSHGNTHCDMRAFYSQFRSFFRRVFFIAATTAAGKPHREYYYPLNMKHTVFFLKLIYNYFIP